MEEAVQSEAVQAEAVQAEAVQADAVQAEAVQAEAVRSVRRRYLQSEPQTAMMRAGPVSESKRKPDAHKTSMCVELRTGTDMDCPIIRLSPKEAKGEQKACEHWSSC